MKTEGIRVFILDTDHITILQRGPAIEQKQIESRLGRCPEGDLYVTIVSFHEQMGGWTAYINRARDAAGLVRGYTMLQELLVDYSELNVLPLDAMAVGQFENLRRAGVRIGTMDLRIASIALVHSFTVITRNAVDFSKVPGLAIEDWTV
jgi:tRNA(fMet)-specific endonuclease VapC